MIAILARKGRCERASIDEVYLDLTDAAETMLAESPPESLDDMEEEVLKSHILGLDDVGTCMYVCIFSDAFILCMHVHCFCPSPFAFMA